MNLNKNYYSLLGVINTSTEKEIKGAYRKLSFIHHPDKKGDPIVFGNITEAYDVLCGDERETYDMKSRYGNNYNEYYELLETDFNFNFDDTKDKLEKFKKNDVFNIYIKVDDTFDGNIEYERWVICKKCDGSGKDFSSKIIIRDNDGKILKMFDADDGCDFCFEENNYVITKRGPIKINEVKIGDKVLTKNNDYKDVYRLMEREYSGELYDIDVCGIKINGVTHNHKLNVVRFERNKSNRIKINDYSIVEIPSSELTLNDFILYQKQTWISKDKIVLSDTINRKNNEIEINEDFIKFLACYIAEGNTRGNRVVVLTFHKEKDKNLIEFVKRYVEEILKTKVKIFSKPKHWGDKVIKIEIFNSQLAKFIKEYTGHTAINKYIHQDILGNSDQILLDTLLLCDGYEKRNLRTYTTISKKLAYQVLHLALGLGHNSSISNYKEHTDKNGVKHKSCYRIYIRYSQDFNKMGAYNKKIKEGICLKVKKINKRFVESTKVYNISVSETHKYTIDGLLVNNCEGIGKDYTGKECSFCSGKGKIGLTPCNTCKGDKRILGKQKLKNIKLTGDETKIEAMGHYSKDEPGKVGYLLLFKQQSSE